MKTVRHQFDSFCKKVIREEARNYIKHIAWRSAHEESLSELSGEQMSQLYVVDEYPSDQTQFSVQGYSIAVKNTRLADALAALPEDKREIVLLSYFFDMTDQEIADSMNLVRSTVQYKRTSSLTEMKKRMEVIDDGEREKN